MVPATLYPPGELAHFMGRLLTIGAFKVNTVEGFKFKHHEQFPNAPKSPTYVNLRVPENKGGPLTKEDVAKIAYFFHRHLMHFELDYLGLGPVPHAGDPLAAALQDRLYYIGGKDVPIVRLGKEVGLEQRRVGGVVSAEGLPKGSRVLVIDDLVTKSHSKAEAIEGLRASGYIVEDCLVFLDREQGGPAEMLAKYGVRLHAITTFSEMLKQYRADGLITSEQLDKIQAYQSDDLAA